MVQLENELRATREDLQTTIEELESSNEELKASNEEVMSMNEELQSTNEELETSKEELQSLNEELAATNSQLREKVDDLNAANSDLTNLLAATDIATVFLDTELRIKRFTPRTGRLFNLLAADVGRPIRDLAPRFTDDDFLGDAERVLESLTPREKEIRTNEDQWYLRRISPYRTLDDRIGGVVISFIDITARTAAEARARRLAGVLHDSKDAIILATPEGRITAWNRGAAQAYGYSESDALAMNMHEITPEPQRQKVAEIAARAARGEEVWPFESQRLTRDGRVLDVWVTLAALKDDRGRIVALARTERDITARRAAEAEILKLNAELEQRVTQRTAALADSEHRNRAILGAAVDAIITIDQDGIIETFNTAAETMFGYAAAEAIGRNVSMLMGSPHRKRHDDYLRRYARTHEKRVIGMRREFRARRKDGTEFPIQLSVSAIPEIGLFTGVVRDMTEQRGLQEEIVGIATLEQRRIGEELHDTTQQELTGLGLLAQNLADALDGRETTRERDLADRLAAGIAKTNAHVRELARGLVPVPVDAEGLMAALAALAQRSRDEHDLRCDFICPEPVRVTDDSVALHLYRIAQEAVTNAIKHAGAETISIRLRYKDGALEVKVRDDGVGIDPDRKNHRGLGLRIMEHRCGLIGGTFSARRHASGGTVVTCNVPLA